MYCYGVFFCSLYGFQLKLIDLTQNRKITCIASSRKTNFCNPTNIFDSGKALLSLTSRADRLRKRDCDNLLFHTPNAYTVHSVGPEIVTRFDCHLINGRNTAF